MNTPIATARPVALKQTGDNSFEWVYADDGTPYIPASFTSADAAKAWMFTPVVIDVAAAPEEKK